MSGDSTGGRRTGLVRARNEELEGVTVSELATWGSRSGGDDRSTDCPSVPVAVSLPKRAFVSLLALERVSAEFAGALEGALTLLPDESPEIMAEDWVAVPSGDWAVALAGGLAGVSTGVWPVVAAGDGVSGELFAASSVANATLSLAASCSESRRVETRSDATGGCAVSREEIGKRKTEVSSATKQGRAGVAALIAPATKRASRWRRRDCFMRRRFIGGSSVEQQSAVSVASCP